MLWKPFYFQLTLDFEKNGKNSTEFPLFLASPDVNILYKYSRMARTRKLIWVQYLPKNRTPVPPVFPRMPFFCAQTPSGIPLCTYSCYLSLDSSSNSSPVPVFRGFDTLEEYQPAISSTVSQFEFIWLSFSLMTGLRLPVFGNTPDIMLCSQCIIPGGSWCQNVLLFVLTEYNVSKLTDMQPGG